MKSLAGLGGMKGIGKAGSNLFGVRMRGKQRVIALHYGQQKGKWKINFMRNEARIHLMHWVCLSEVH